MKHTFQCIASPHTTDEWLDHMTRFRLHHHKYRFGDETVYISTYFSTTTVSGTLYIYHYDELPDTVPFQNIATALVITDIPSELTTMEYTNLLNLHDYCIKHNIYIVLLARPEKESRDEVYYKIFTWLIEHTKK
jgi:hypothetical protein